MLDFAELRRSVLAWLGSLQIADGCCRHTFSAGADETIFCSCFALFILDLFRETDKFTNEQRQKWISHLRSFQNKEYGYFEPKKFYHQDKERNRFQLTCFCLSALTILGAQPGSPLRFVEQWKTPDDVRAYLSERGCHQGSPGSGNKAMFQAIFLTYEYERVREDHLLDKIDAWFEFHNKTQNRNGFWGAERKSHYLHGLQNGFHQLEIYFYWQRDVPRLERIVDVALMSQDKQGFFSPTPGGEACHDYDALHTLAMAYKTIDYRKSDIEACMRRAFDAIMSTSDDDGGFCQSKYKLTSLADFLRYIPIYCSGRSPYLWYFRARACLVALLKQQTMIHTGWTKEPRSWGQSNLWDTWFRCLTVAEIAHTIDDERMQGFRNVNFHKALGLGYFPG